jgi:ABC-type Fe3+ transport system permease subunit
MIDALIDQAVLFGMIAGIILLVRRIRAKRAAMPRAERRQRDRKIRHTVGWTLLWVFFFPVMLVVAAVDALT